MFTRKECFDRLASAAPQIQQDYGVTSMLVFGSVARGDNHEGSDVDIFVEMSPKFMKFLKLADYLEDLLGTSVDLIRKHNNINEMFLNEVKRDGVVIF